MFANGRSPFDNDIAEEIMDIIITKHAERRIKERVPGMKSESKRAAFVADAMARGVRQAESRGAGAAYLRHRKEIAAECEEYAGRDMVLYRDYIFVLEGGTLITVLPRSLDYGRRMERERAKRRRVREKRAGESARVDLTGEALAAACPALI